MVEEICRQWSVGEHQATWTAAHLAAARIAVANAHEELDRSWVGPEQAKELAFEVTILALRSMCGEIDLPDNRLELEDALDQGDTWFKELWQNRVYPMAWTSVTGVGDTN